MEIITESQRDYYYKRLYIDPALLKKQRLLDTFMFGFLGALLGFTTAYISKLSVPSLIAAVVVTIFAGYIGYKYRYMKIMSLVSVQEAKVTLMFPEFLQTFISLLDANPSASIVTVLESSIPYLRVPIRNEVMKLVKAIYTDGRNESVRNSMNVFSSYMNTEEARRIMMLIYSMYEEGSNPNMLKELEEKVDQLNQNKVNAYVLKKSSSLMGRSFWALVMTLFFIFSYIGMLLFAFGTSAFTLF